ncbi:MAG: PAS domain S-box protein [Nitrospirae bacterium]|nr:PAS domain S-box protein [Nitrospirota bacterium]
MSDMRTRKGRRAGRKASAGNAKIEAPESPEELKRVTHELQVHQIELELQNDELRRFQIELEASRTRYSDLYDYAPVGYMTLNEQGLILEANLTAVTMIGKAKGALMKQPISRFILSEDLDIYDRHCKQFFEIHAGCSGQANTQLTCELRLKKSAEEEIWIRLESTAVKDKDGNISYRAVMSDITAQKLLDAELGDHRMHLEDMVGMRTRELESMVARLMEEIDRRKEVEETLERNRLLLNGVFNSIQDGIVVLDLDMNVLMANSMIEKMFNDGKPLGFKKTRCFELYRNKERRCNNCLAFRAIATKTVQVGSITHEATEAGTRWLEVSSFPFVDNRGESRGVIQYLKDITERKLAAERIIESEKRYRDLFENAGEGILLLSMNSDIIATNASFARMHGFSVEEIMQMKLADLEVRLDPQVHDARLKRIFSDRRHIFEVEHLHREGHTIELEVSVSYVELDGEKVFLCFHRDISDRKKTEEALRESEERFRGLLDDAPVAISIVNRDGCVEYINRRHAELLGYDLQDIPTLEDWWARAYPAETDRSRIRTAWHELAGRAYQGEKISPVERNVVCKDGSSRNLELRIKAAAEKIIVVFSDITERKRFEHELKLREARLIQANKMASLGLLVSGVAHEVNNPNNFIMFNSSLLKDAWPDIEVILDRHASTAGPFHLASLPYHEMKEAVPKLLSGISDGSSRIKGIVERLREFACEGRSCLNGTIDVNASVRSSVMILQNQIAKHTDNFVLNLADALPIVKGSPQQIEQVIINLIMNALQALRSRRDFIVVATMYHKDISRIIIEVQDSGVGIAAPALERIMEPFFTTRLGSGGTGLGLSISNSIVKDHNGILEFLSEEGKGTTVRVHLPEMKSRTAPGDESAGVAPGDSA